MNRIAPPLVLLWGAVGAGIAFAAEKHGAHAEPTISSLFLPLVNFALFAFLFARYAWPVIRGALTERRTVVVKELSEAEAGRKEAAALLADIEGRRARLREEGERITREMRADAERERAALLETARHTAERIRSDAILLGEQEAARAAQVIREEIAGKVVALVSRALRERLDEADERRFVHEFVATIEREAAA
jgi:F-type H+-transporting ATPase subunit b